MGAGELGQNHSEAGVFVDPRLGLAGFVLPGEGVEALFDEFAVGPVPGVTIERVGQQPIGGVQQPGVGFDGFGTDLLRGVRQGVDMIRGDATRGEPFPHFGHLGQLAGCLGHPFGFAAGEAGALAEDFGGVGTRSSPSASLAGHVAHEGLDH